MSDENDRPSVKPRLIGVGKGTGRLAISNRSFLVATVLSAVWLGGVVAYSGGFARAPNLPDEKTEAEVQAVSMLLHK